MLTFCKLFPDATNPLRADRAALGQMPLDAFRYCEPMRQSSAYGWYFFPPLSFDLDFDGVQVRFRTSGDWEVLSEAYLPGFVELWASMAPPDLLAVVPPFIRALHSPRGAVQIWSGFLVSSSNGWSTCVRAPVNMALSSQYCHYEGIVETDIIPACPLFTNIQLTRTRETVRILKEVPLFQVQPIERSSYSLAAHESTTKVPAASATRELHPMTDEDWRHFRAAVRTDDSNETHRMGDYGAEVRRRAKADPPGQ